MKDAMTSVPATAATASFRARGKSRASAQPLSTR
jgi:hypothetical protein